MAPTAVCVSPAALYLLSAVLVFGAAARFLARLRPSATLEDQQAEEEAQAVEERSFQSTPGVSYSIFLSHSRKQKGFVERLNEHLVRAGHFAFFDIHSIPIGEAFPQYIKQAAIHTKLGVVTLSDDFMSSKWPMIELELFTKHAAKVVPLYYKLSVDDLKSPKKLATWKKKWQKMAREDKTIDVSEWEKAARNLVRQNGVIYGSETTEGAYIKTVVTRVCEQLPPRVIYHLPYVKGQIRFIQELQTQFQCKRVIGMHGIGGQGKTTLCQVMANFHGSTHSLTPAILEFPSENREDKERIDKIVKECKKALKRLGLVNKELMEDVDRFAMAMQVMKDRMEGQRIFLALDNVWDHCQEEASEILKVVFDPENGFHPDSKVLVTSRSEELLKGLLTKFDDKALVRPLISVNEDEALEIFGASFEGDLSHASGNSLNRALSLCKFSSSYHPMALKSLGQKLNDMGRAGDPNAIEENLAQISPDLEGGERMYKLIRLNYDSRNCVGKGIFLDVAVVFRRTGSFKLTDGDVEYEEMRNWLRSLYKDELAGDEIDIQLQRLALAGLVQFEGDGKQRTVRVHDLYVSLAEREAAASSRILLPGRGNMEAVKWEELERVVLDTRYEVTVVELQRCPKLQLLYARGQRFSKGLQLEGATALRLLKVVDCMGKLNGLKGLPKLEAVHLQAESSDGIEAILRDVRRCAPLKSLVLAGEGFCVGGEDDAVCLRALTNLRSIQLCGSERLLELPDSTLGVSRSPCSLEALHLWHCTRLQKIPDLGHFVQLHELNLRKCGALVEMGGMALPSNLEILVVDECKRLQKIPDVGGCASLRELGLRKCGALEEIVGKALPSNLEILVVDECKRLQKIPDVGGCASLRELDLRECEGLKEMGGMALPTNLEILRVDKCKSLQKIPDVGGCASLRKLKLRGCEALEEIVGTALSSNMEILRLYVCRSLQTIPSVDRCASLRELDMQGCEALEKIFGTALPSNLEILRVHQCNRLQKIADVGGCALLQLLELQGCEALEEIVGTALPSNLEILRLYECTRLPKIPDVGGCASLQMLELQGCEALKEIVGTALPSNLEILRLYKCRSLQKIPGVGASLRELDMRGCEALKEIVGMALPSNLEILRLYECKSLQKIPGVGGCASLRELDLRGCEALKEMGGMALPTNLEILRVDECKSLQKIPDVGGCASLRELDLRGCEALKEIVGTALPSNLEILQLYECTSLEKIPDMGGCASLRKLDLQRCVALKEIVGMALPSNLEMLRLYECGSLRKIPDVGGCASLPELDLQRCEALEEIVGMALPSNLEILRLYECKRLRKIPDVGGCASLRVLELLECEALEEIVLPSNLEWAMVDKCPRLQCKIPDSGCAYQKFFDIRGQAN